MLIRPLDLEDDAEIRALARIFIVAAHAEGVEAMLPPEEVFVLQIREPGGGMEREAYVGVDDEVPDAPIVGGSMLFLPQTDNTDKAYLGATVHPDHQRRGYGTALANHITARAEAKGRTLLLSDGLASFEHRDDNGPRRFAEGLGFQVASTEVMRRLDLPIADERLDEWIADAAEKHAGYEIRTFDEVPDELLASLTHVHNQLAADAPTGEVEFEAERTTPEQTRERRERDAKAGEVTLDAVAVDATGQVVAASTLHVHQDRSAPIHQGSTLVLREHRGHRLGLAVKAANIRELQRRFPDATAIVTSNEETNANMVSINEQIGFEPKALHAMFMRAVQAG